MKIMRKKPFVSQCNLDSVSINCPCGNSISGEGEVISDFIKKHKNHTNGKCKDYITDDGMRAFTNDSKRERTFLV